MWNDSSCWNFFLDARKENLLLWFIQVFNLFHQCVEHPFTYGKVQMCKRKPSLFKWNLPNQLIYSNKRAAIMTLIPSIRILVVVKAKSIQCCFRNNKVEKLNKNIGYLMKWDRSTLYTCRPQRTFEDFKLKVLKTLYLINRSFGVLWSTYKCVHIIFWICMHCNST